ncbi:TetR/AcrR family transcriptional regulator [Pararhodobacter sp. CCB-MM2]|uniref:TetR/AcrR family transcriptional regulator n=1 Tax=Pararhodobacter sp. CCB-MM2 TaxID=1786003 RepID=UPI0008307629|nr:TetR/AcrR family transcriptional regulator [Pararhodobacter sp. CCB-MM2]
MARKPGSRSDITGPRLREAALRLFARQGYAAVSMRQIAAEIGVQAGALYLYTADKQSLLCDLMTDHLEALLMAWEAEALAGDAPSRLEQFARFHMRFHAERADEIFIAYNELRNLTPENFARVEALRKRYETALETILREGREAGALQLEDPKLAAMAIIAMLTGVNTWFREGGRLSRERVEDLYAGMVLRTAGARE